MSKVFPIFNASSPLESLSSMEQLKFNSRHLRGNIAKGLNDTITGAVPGDDPLLMKFHGIYQQDDRDIRASRQERKLEPAYRFMTRLRIPGGTLTAAQWLGLDQLSRKYAERGLRITTRQTIQFHGVKKRHLRPCLQGLRSIGLDTVSACGDDNRGVVCGANPAISAVNLQVRELAKQASERLRHRTNGYAEIWYGESGAKDIENEEPVFRELYLPRKFKVGFVIPPINDVDIYGQDVGFIAIVENGKLAGFNLCVGGGMGRIDGRADSYPRLATEIGFVEVEDMLSTAETIMIIQRDFGDRKDRHQARFKYTLDRYGMNWFLELLATRRGKPLAKARPFKFELNGDRPGWLKADDGLWYGTMLIQSGRIDHALRDQLAAFFQQYAYDIRLTTNQNMQFIGIPDHALEQVKWRLDDLGLSERFLPDNQSGYTMSCVALPTCGLAMAEAERYLPKFLDAFNAMKAKYQLAEQPITLRITGCPNGCARPYLAEIALTGRAIGLYNLYLGGSFTGNRMATLYRPNASEAVIFQELDQLFASYSKDRLQDEHFGDYLHRTDKLKAAAKAAQK